MVLHISSQVIRLVNVTVSVPGDLKEVLDRHPEINWSEVARQAWKDKAGQLELLDKITSSSRASDKDVEALAKMIKKGVSDWHDKQA